MSEFIALDFDSQSSPLINIKCIDVSRDSASSVWGFGWYPNDNYTAMVIKDATQENANKLSHVVTDWNNFRSTVFMCKTKGVTRQYTLHDVQPFSWSFAGQDWLFLHNGHLDKAELEKKHDTGSGFLVPLGYSDTELLFCYLLGKIQESGAKELNDVNGNDILQWLAEIESLGSMDIMLSDCKTMLVYHGVNSSQDIFITRVEPPNNGVLMDSESVSVIVDDPRDSYHSCFIACSERLSNTKQRAMMPGELILVRRSVVVWQGINGTTIPSPVKDIDASADQPLPQRFIQTEYDQVALNKNIVNLKSITHRPDGKALEFKSYEVNHVTTYEYQKAVEHSTHTFRLQPSEDPTQDVIRSEIAISVDGERVQYEDVFGNQTIYYTINQSYLKLQITAKSQVKIYERLPDNRSDLVRRTSIPLIWMPWQRQMMSPFLLPPELPESQLQVLTEYAMSFVERCDYNLLETLKDMNLRIYQDFKYVQGVTSLMTTPFEVFESRKGVCQDFANLFICLAQLMSIPARYRVGYIYTGADYSNKIQSEASHAWAEVYIPFLGWKGFDPTNGCVVGQSHIRVACGRNYRDTAPTTGTLFKGGDKEKLSVDVKILPL